MTMARGRTEHMPGQAVRLNTYEDILAILDFSFDQDDMRLLIENAFKDHHAEIAVWRRQRRFPNLSDESFVAKTITNEIGNGDDLQIMLLGELEQIGNPGHAAIFFHDFAD